MSTTVRIADATLCRENNGFSFKEKLEIARQLERVRADVIELPEIANERADILFVRTASAFVKNSVLSVAAGSDSASVKNAIAALSAAAHPRIRVTLPVSPVGMEYIAHRKPPKLLEWITEAVSTARASIADVEFCAVDATRAEPEFLADAIRTAVKAGATTVSVCDTASEMLPDEFAEFIAGAVAVSDVPVGVLCENRNGLAAAEALIAAQRGATEIKTCADGPLVPLETFAGILRACGERCGLSTNLLLTELHRTVRQIRWIIEGGGNAMPAEEPVNDQLLLDENDSLQTVSAAVARLGYDLSEEDQKRVYDAVLQTAAKKKQVGTRELEAIVASTAMQVPSAYQLVHYLISCTNVVEASAQITLSRDGKNLSAICMANGSIAAAFNAIEQIIGRHYAIDDFQIQSVTEGRESLGSALVRLRSDGKLYSGSGISTDVVGASIRAYLSAANKVLYEEEAQA